MQSIPNEKMKFKCTIKRHKSFKIRYSAITPPPPIVHVILSNYPYQCKLATLKITSKSYFTFSLNKIKCYLVQNADR